MNLFAQTSSNLIETILRLERRTAMIMRVFTVTQLRRNRKVVFSAAEFAPILITRYGKRSFVLMTSIECKEKFPWLFSDD